MKTTFSVESCQAPTASSACAFSVDAADLAAFLKQSEIFRKAHNTYGHGIDADSLFIDFSGGGCAVTVYGNHGAFRGILPGSGYGQFCIPYGFLLRAMKGVRKGAVTLQDGTLTIAGAAMDCPIGQAPSSHADVVIQRQIDRPMLCPFWGFRDAARLPWLPLAAVLPAISDDASKAVLNGAYSNGTYCYGTDGHRLRRSLVARPAWGDGAPTSQWLPRHALLMVKASTPKRDATTRMVHTAQDGAYDFAQWTTDNGRQYFSLRWERQSVAYPECDKLWPDTSNHRYTFQAKRADMLAAVIAIQDRLKTSDGLPYIDMELRPGQVKLSAILQKNTSTKKYCPEYFTIGQVDQTISATYDKHADWDNESDCEAYTRAELAQRRNGLIVLNARYLREMLESLEGHYVTISTVTATTPVTFNGNIPGDGGIIMPIQRRH